MGAHISCPNAARLQGLLAGKLPETDQAELTGHLDSCTGCQQSLEEMAAGNESWPEQLRGVDRERPPSDSAYWAALRELEQDTGRTEALAPSAAPAAAPSLDFLSPAEGPGYIGRLSHFDVVEVIGQGGMGVVLKAFDGCLQRHVALKVLDPLLANNETARKRFCREARAAASISHEHVVSVYQVEREEDSGLPFLVMQLIVGESLQERIDRAGALPLKDIVWIGMQVSRGLAAAHARGLIHRDIKPANILLEEGNRVRLTDFGLARAFDDVKLTQSGFVPGTPLYMAPEQARGLDLDHRADLFSLGSVLYALCTGKPPFDGSTPYVVLKSITEEAATPIDELNPALPGWLIEIVERLHAKDPAERFQSAAEVADVLGRHLVEVLHATGESPCGGSAAVAPRSSSRSVRRLARGRLSYLSLAAVGIVALLAGMVLGDLTGLSRSLVGVPHGDVPEHQEAAAASGPPPRATLESNAGPIWSVAFSPDGKTLATAVDDGAVKLWDLRNGNVTDTINAHDGPIWSVAFSPDGGRMATASDDGTAKVWDAKTCVVLHTLQHVTSVRAVAFAPDGKTLATASRNGSVRLWDTATGKERDVHIQGHKGIVMSLAFAPDGQTVASAGGTDKVIRIWDVKTGREKVTLAGHKAGVYAVTFAPDGKTLASGSWDHAVRTWEAATGKELATLRGHTQDVWAVAFSPDGRRLASASEDRTVKVWDVRSGEELATFKGHLGSLYAVAFSSDGKTIASGGRDGTVKLWDAATAGAR